MICILISIDPHLLLTIVQEYIQHKSISVALTCPGETWTSIYSLSIRNQQETTAQFSQSPTWKISVFIVIAHRSRWLHSSCIIPLQIPQSTDECWLRKSATLVHLAQPASSSTGLRENTKSVYQSIVYCLSLLSFFSPPRRDYLNSEEVSTQHSTSSFGSCPLSPLPLLCSVFWTLPVCMCWLGVLLIPSSDSALKHYHSDSQLLWGASSVFMNLWKEKKKPVSFPDWSQLTARAINESKYRCLEGTVICTSVEQNNSSCLPMRPMTSPGIGVCSCL